MGTINPLFATEFRESAKAGMTYKEMHKGNVKVASKQIQNEKSHNGPFESENEMVQWMHSLQQSKHLPKQINSEAWERNLKYAMQDFENKKKLKARLTKLRKKRRKNQRRRRKERDEKCTDVITLERATPDGLV